MSHGTLATLRRAGVGIVLATVAGASGAAVSDGQWKGIINTDAEMARASVTLRGDTMHLRFGEPNNCQIQAELLDDTSEQARFRFNPSANGGAFCTGLYPGDVLATATPEGLVLSFQRAGRGWDGTLATQQTP